jgi:hypothetical protein
METQILFEDKGKFVSKDFELSCEREFVKARPAPKKYELHFIVKPKKK